jgi:uncharacterized lipoprotein
MNTSTRFLVAALAGALALASSGCNLFKGRRSAAYETAGQSRPLEVPPDLDSPSTAGTMQIPEAGSGAAAAAAEGVPSMGTPRGPTTQAVYAGNESSLNLKDGAAGAWRRVGLAIERSGVAEIVSRDESQGTFTVKAEGRNTGGEQEKPGFVRRMFGRDEVKAESDAGARVVRVRAEGEGSIVVVEDEAGNALDDEIARRVIAAIKQRLG